MHGAVLRGKEKSECHDYEAWSEADEEDPSGHNQSVQKTNREATTTAQACSEQGTSEWQPFNTSAERRSDEGWLLHQAVYLQPGSRRTTFTQEHIVPSWPPDLFSLWPQLLGGVRLVPAVKAAFLTA